MAVGMEGTMWNRRVHVEQQNDNFDATDNEITCARRDNGQKCYKSNQASGANSTASKTTAVPVVTN